MLGTYTLLARAARFWRTLKSPRANQKSTTLRRRSQAEVLCNAKHQSINQRIVARFDVIDSSHTSFPLPLWLDHANSEHRIHLTLAHRKVLALGAIVITKCRDSFWISVTRQNLLNCMFLCVWPCGYDLSCVAERSSVRTVRFLLSYSDSIDALPKVSVFHH